MITTLELKKKEQLGMSYIDATLSGRDTSIGISYSGRVKKEEGEVFDSLNTKLFSAAESLVGTIYEASGNVD